MKGGLWMYIFLLLLVGLMLRNAAGTVGILVGGGGVTNQLFGTLSGQGIKANSGTFSAGGNSVKLA